MKSYLHNYSYDRWFFHTILYIHKLSHTPRILSLGSLWEELVMRIQNGGLTTQQDTEKRRESFLIWLIFDRNFNLQRGKSFNSSFNFMFFHDPRRSESIRVDPTRTGGPSWSGPTFVPACYAIYHS